ncbi:MAG: NAD(P)-dependent oxidoreductase [Fibrobacter sp.]|nr:NAD(P)-dependent oxidoreductase [Fibrobacter sp.]
MKSIILFGGSGFVGTHLVPYILKKFDRIFIADIKNPCWHSGTTLPESDKIEFVPCDVSKSIGKNMFSGTVECIINLAAVHTSPGHKAKEYFDVNIHGAKNICEYAERVNCDRIVFTSSISVYGPGEDEKSEDIIPMPAIPYGSSKIIAEYIHREWFYRATGRRKLTILRPGVIFGKGEGGNFTRIANALERGMFSYPGRIDTIKACLYVKDICKFISETLEKESGLEIFNFCYPEKITLQQIVKTFKKVLGYRAPEIVVPYSIIRGVAACLNIIPLPSIKQMGLVPERIVKLIRSTNISSEKLIQSGFSFQFSFEEALRDWGMDCGGRSLY